MTQAMPAGPAGAPPPVAAPVVAPGHGRVGRPLALLALPLLALAGCAQGATEASWWNPMGLGPAPTSPPPATGVVLPVRAADPLAAFAARAQPGQTETVATADGGRLVSARMVRAYNAASGRECRELQFGSSAAPAGGARRHLLQRPRPGMGRRPRPAARRRRVPAVRRAS